MSGGAPPHPREATGRDAGAGGWLLRDADRVRATIAALLLDGDRGDDGFDRPSREPPASAPLLGDVTLLPHQRDALTRVQAAMSELGGALLADDVGLGKTYVALAAARDVPDAVVVGPAALRATWRDAMRRTHVVRPYVGIESLGRRPRDGTGASKASTSAPSLVIVDEAHHARNPATRRYAALAALAVRARVLLLSATPVHNRADDLRALLALFLGARAASLDDATLARCIVRRRTADVHAGGGHVASRAATMDPRTHVPRVGPVRALHVADDARMLARLERLPPPVPPADGGVAAALVTLSLVRQWASSVAALRAALRRRLARSTAIAAALRAGRRPTAAELRRAVVADDAVQLGFPELFATRAPDAAALLDALDAHERAVRATLHALDDRADVARADALARVRAAHPGASIVAFSSYAATVASLFRRLRHGGGVCALGARGATVAGGALTRREALHRFAPRAHGRAPPPRASAITLLLATDVLSEGIGLQDASVVVHLDLPWTPSRLAQRVGRVARLGSLHADVSVYAFMPPVALDAWIGVERRLRAKLGEAARVIGTSDAVLPAGAAVCARGAGPFATTHTAAVATTTAAPVEDAEALRAILRSWRRPAPDAGTAVDADDADDANYDDDDDDDYEPRDPASPRGAPHIGAVPGPAAHLGAALAVVGWPPRPLARLHAAAPLSSAPATLRAVATVVSSGSAIAHDDEVREALDALASWRQSCDAAAALGTPTLGAARARLLRRVARAVADAPRGRRAQVAALAQAARRALAEPGGAGTERRFAELLAWGAAEPHDRARDPTAVEPGDAVHDDESLLRAIAAVGRRGDRGSDATHDGRTDVKGATDEPAFPDAACLHALLVVVAS